MIKHLPARPFPVFLYFAKGQGNQFPHGFYLKQGTPAMGIPCVIRAFAKWLLIFRLRFEGVLFTFQLKLPAFLPLFQFVPSLVTLK